MAVQDRRRPIEVTRELRGKLARALAEHGFAAQRQQSVFVRRDGTATDRIELSSSHHNAPGHVTCWVALTVEDKAIARLAPRWRAGGGLGSPAFAQDRSWNIANPTNAKRLLAHIASSLEFFELAADASAVLAQACRRYVPGFVTPAVIVPYLRVRLGEDAVAAYARAFLDGRPELWPAFLGRRGRARAGKSARLLDHGSELALMLATHARSVELAAPSDAVSSRDLAAHLRDFFGLQLRAWGEPEAAALLRRVPDPRIKQLDQAQKRIRMTVDDPVSAGLALREATGKRRPLRRKRPEPRFFQYHVRHEPFA